MQALFLVLLALACPLACVGMAVAMGVGARRSMRKKSTDTSGPTNAAAGDSERTSSRAG